MSTSRRFSDLTGKQKAVELLRWLAVLPAAILAERITRLIVVLPFYFMRHAGWYTPGEPSLLYYPLLLLFYFPKGAAFIIAGAAMAPRSRLATSIVLAGAAILISLAIHILMQQYVGVTNFTHFVAESAGALCGAGCIYFFDVMNRRHRAAQRANN